jgi:hypothetical protein
MESPLNEPHSIRLAGPWMAIDLQPHPASTMPERFQWPHWQPSGEQHCGWRRSFNVPTGLADGDRLFLQCDGLPIGTTVVFNDRELGKIAATSPPITRFEITTLLVRSNQVLLIPLPDLPPSGSITLVITPNA